MILERQAINKFMKINWITYMIYFDAFKMAAFYILFVACFTANTQEKNVLLDYNSHSIELNKAGYGYPSQYTGEGNGEAVTTIDSTDCVKDNCLNYFVEHSIYAQFNPRDSGGNRGFAREYVRNPSNWKFNTYNRFSFWIKAPVGSMELKTNGTENMHFGTYVKQVSNPDPTVDETGNNHWYHHLVVPPTGTWTKVVINMHPNHLRSVPGSTEHGNQPHPTQEEEYNYFDALTRFYIMAKLEHETPGPKTWKFDEFTFYQESNVENEDQVYSITATYVSIEKRVILTWARHKDENSVNHEVRYSYSNIHELGWENATPAPDGIVPPPGWQGYNKMVYDQSIDLSSESVVYFAIKPENSHVFSQISLPVINEDGVKAKHPVSGTPYAKYDPLNFAVTVDPQDHSVRIRLYSVSGKVFLNKLLNPESGSEQVSLPVNQLKSGLYLVEISRDGFPDTSVFKLVK